ncbi:MAG: NADH-quinone oxidoreductase subunit J family protein [Planctomycetota bacterium]|jgi:NADH-quinone oxidoreductase subunit J
MLELLLFYLFAIMAVVGGLMAVLLPRIVHAVFSLLLCFLGVTGVYLLAGADFLAITQLVVYVGGVLVLLAFGILLTGRTALTLADKEVHHRPTGVIVGLLLFGGLLWAVGTSSFHLSETEQAAEGTTSGIGRLLLGDYIILFEFASILLLVALVGAAYLVRRQRA